MFALLAALVFLATGIWIWADGGFSHTVLLYFGLSLWQLSRAIERPIPGRSG